MSGDHKEGSARNRCLKADVWVKRKAKETRDDQAVLACKDFDSDLFNGTSSQSTTAFCVISKITDEYALIPDGRAHFEVFGLVNTQWMQEYRSRVSIVK